MKAIALLGRRDEPTDGVTDYCNSLARALRKRAVELEIVRVPWAERGWSEALRWLSHESRRWSGQWVLLQYTALAWSRRGFSIRVRQVLKLLQRNSARCAVVFHDAQAYEGARLRDWFRRKIQHWTMQGLLVCADQSIFTVPLKSATWMHADSLSATFVPVGANIPSHTASRKYTSDESPKTIAVFCITGGEKGAREIRDIALAVREVHARLGPVCLEVFGRGAEDSESLFREALKVSGIWIRVRGILSAEEITRCLATADVLLFVRGIINSHRTTAIAGISCGIPVVGYGNSGDDPAIDSAGVRLAPWHNPDALAAELVHVLADAQLWQELHDRSLAAQSEYFSWDAIAGRYAQLLGASEIEHERR